MSPRGVGEEGFGNRSWDGIEIPAITMSGTPEGGVNGDPPELASTAVSAHAAG
jgi:hypothetical protein